MNDPFAIGMAFIGFVCAVVALFLIVVKVMEDRR